MSGLDLARRAAFEAKTVIARYPGPALAIARRRHGEAVGPGTGIVIEGFPRTGTSFAVAAFRLAQPEPVSVACHVHAPAQVLAAIRRKLPALVIAREPGDTILSFAIRNPHLSMAQALRGYLRFYEPLLPHRGRFVTAAFAEVTDDFGEVTRRVNDRFGTTFAEFEHTPENVRICFEQIDEDYGRRLGGADLERSVARPSELRRELKEGLRARYGATGLARLRARATRAYEVLAAR